MTPMLRLWGRMSSINVRKTVWTLRELSLAYERLDAGGTFGVVDTPQYRRHNPNGLVPLLEDGDFVLWESNVIVRYLCAKHAPGTLCPDSLPGRADAERWMDWQQTTVNPAGRDAFIQLVRTPAEKRNAELLERSITATERLFALLDHHLADRAYLCGAHFTMADIPLGCEAHRWFNLPRTHATWPHVERWYAALRARPATDTVLDQPLQ
jgi:glutathione S-transferase